MPRAPSLALSAALLAASGGTAWAQGTSAPLTPDQKGYIVYHQCMLEAAMKASYTSARDDEIYSIAKPQCADVRSAATRGQEGNTQYLAALDAADAEKAQHFPAWIKGVRERRRLREAQSAKP